MKNNLNSFDKALGLLFNLNKGDQLEFFNLLEENWFQSGFHESIYLGIKYLINESKVIDLINITTYLRENDLLEKDTIYKLSIISTNIDFTETLNKEGILNDCWYNYSVRKVFVMVQNINTEMLKSDPRSNYILQEVSKVKELLTVNKAVKEITNLESIEKVIFKHNQAKLGIPLGLELGWDCLKNELILEKDDVMVVGGRPAMGKTAWGISLIRNLCYNENKVVIFFSLEMAHDRIIRRIISNITGIDSNHIKYGKCSTEELRQINILKSHSFWDNLVIFDGSHTTKDIEAKIQTISNKKKISLWMVDYLQKIMPTKSESRYHEVTKISNDLKRIVMAHRIPCIALAQLSRDVGRSGKRPSLPDLKESGEIEQDASIVSFLHRPEYYGEFTDDDGNNTEGMGEFIIAKNRDGGIGINNMEVSLKNSQWNDEKLKEYTIIKSDQKPIDYYAGFKDRNEEIPF